MLRQLCADRWGAVQSCMHRARVHMRGWLDPSVLETLTAQNSEESGSISGGDAVALNARRLKQKVHNLVHRPPPSDVDPTCLRSSLMCPVTEREQQVCLGIVCCIAICGLVCCIIGAATIKALLPLAVTCLIVAAICIFLVALVLYSVRPRAVKKRLAACQLKVHVLQDLGQLRLQCAEKVMELNMLLAEEEISTAQNMSLKISLEACRNQAERSQRSIQGLVGHIPMMPLGDVTRETLRAWAQVLVSLQVFLDSCNNILRAARVTLEAHRHLEEATSQADSAFAVCGGRKV